MKKCIGFFLSALLMIGIISLPNFFQPPRESGGKGDKGRIVFTQGKEREQGERKGDTESYFVLVLKEMKQKVDGWLKSLNERIEREDVTRFEVRFLEILRSILEWVKEKIDLQIESAEKSKPEKKDKGRFQEIHQRVLPFSERA
jgi:hypothetical protein